MAARSALALVCIALIAVSHVRASCTWSVTNPQFATIAAGLAFSTDTVGWSPVSDNGSGSFVLTTSDGGKTWNQYAAPSGVLLFLGAAESGSAAVASDTFGLDFSLNAAQSFNTSIVPNGITSQNVMAFRNDPDSFGAAGQSLFGQNGAAVSNDAGLSFTWSNISILSTQARYGAYPSAKTWFISAGQWPNNAEEDSSRTTISELSARLSVSMSEVDGKMSVKAFPPRQRVAADNSTGWAAQIVKTTDGGQTWTSLFSSTSFYFNQIDCYSETHCAAVGEADTSDKPGIRIHVTFDGQTWTETYFNPDPNESIFALNFISDNEIWAAGGLLSSTAFTGKFYHSTDGGKSWTIDEVPDVYGNAMSFPTAGSGNVGYATAFNAESISSFLTCA